MTMAEIIQKNGEGALLQVKSETTTPSGTTPENWVPDFAARVYILQLEGKQRTTYDTGKAKVETTHRAYTTATQAATLLGQPMASRRLVDAAGRIYTLAQCRPVRRSLTDNAVDHYAIDLVDTGKVAGT